MTDLASLLSTPVAPSQAAVEAATATSGSVAGATRSGPAGAVTSTAVAFRTALASQTALIQPAPAAPADTSLPDEAPAVISLPNPAPAPVTLVPVTLAGALRPVPATAQVPPSLALPASGLAPSGQSPPLAATPADGTLPSGGTGLPVGPLPAKPMTGPRAGGSKGDGVSSNDRTDDQPANADSAADAGAQPALALAAAVVLPWSPIAAANRTPASGAPASGPPQAALTPVLQAVAASTSGTTAPAPLRAESKAPVLMVAALPATGPAPLLDLLPTPPDSSAGGLVVTLRPVVMAAPAPGHGPVAAPVAAPVLASPLIAGLASTNANAASRLPRPGPARPRAAPRQCRHPNFGQQRSPRDAIGTRQHHATYH
jgi:Meckel syndrome type 1 protein